jgi:hypothetical protein
MLDTLRGIGLVVFIAALAGGIAYVGDRVGHQVGRKRLTLFGIRPRYTSTIIAIGTGVVIALIVTLGAIFASQEVKTAFFKLYSINEQIETLQTRQAELETKVNNTQVVAPLDSPMTSRIARLPKGSSADDRAKIVRNFYAETVNLVDQSLAPPLKPFIPPQNLDALLQQLANGQKTQSFVAANDAFVIATADRNLFVGDRIHFQFSVVPDKLTVPSGQAIASVLIPGGSNVNVGLAFNELQQHVVEQLARLGIPPFFVGTPQSVRTFPSADQMQKMLTGGKGTFIMTAFAATDIYPHTSFATGSIPIVVALQQQK